MDRAIPSGVVARPVGFRHRAGLVAATHILLDLGHRDVAVIVGG